MKSNLIRMCENLLSVFFRVARLCVPLLLICQWAIAQNQITVSGRVTNATNQPLAGVSVGVKGSSGATTTDDRGQYEIRVPSGSTILVYTYLGMVSQEVPISGRSSINVVLEEGGTNLDEVVVVGYGTQSRETLTTAVSKMDARALENIPYANPASALQGTVSGVRVQSTSGQPGAAPRIIVRGGTSIDNPNGAAPLYIIDGVIRSNMDDINSDDIESLQVLKDAASTAIYGARASNGVVIITTKSGSADRTSVTYSYGLMSSEIGKRYDMASAEDYIYYSRVGAVVANRKVPGSDQGLIQPSGWGTGNDLTKNTGFTTQYLTPQNEHKLNEGWKSMPDPVDPARTIIFQETDWQDVLFQRSTSHDHHLSISGGNEKAQINGSVGYLTNEGIAITTKYDRLSANLGGNLKINDKLSFNSKILYTYSSNNSVYNNSELFFRAAGLAPTAKYMFEDGTLAPGNARNMGNPAYYLNNRDNENSIENLSVMAAADWKPIEGLTITPQASLYKVSTDNYAFIHSYLNGVGNYNETRSASSAYNKTMQTQADLVANYNKYIGQHGLDATAGFSYFKRYVLGLSASGQGAATNLIPTLNASATPTAVSGNQSDFAMLGYFARVNYHYAQKYLLSVTGRYDGASNLGANHKWGLFPGISFGWNAHRESFFEPLSSVVSQLKLRGSYGVNGNISGLSDFHAQGAYSVGARYLGSSAIQNTVLANSNLRWEQSRTFDVGADFGFFNNRISVLFDYYRRVTDDLITNLTLPPSTGFSSISTNLGSLENRGVEVEFTAEITDRDSDLAWDVSFNASTVKSKIIRLPENGAVNNRVGGVYVWDPAINGYNWLGGLQEDGRIGDFFAWQQVGIYSTDAEAASAALDLTMPFADKTKFGGDVNYLDLDRNDTLDTRDLVYQGNPYPTLTGGFSTSLSYKGFSLYLRMDFTKGHTIYNHAKIFQAGTWAGNLNFPQEMVEQGWSQQGDVATRPQYIPGTANFSYWRGSAYHLTSTNSEFYEKGDFLSLREITLSYSLPQRIVNKVKLHNARINLTANNLYYFTNYTGMNPEDGGLDQGRYPIPRSIILGIKVGL